MESVRRRVGLWLAIILGAAAPFAYSAPPGLTGGDDAPATQPAEPALSPQERAAKIQTMFKQLVQQMQDKDWPSALTTVEDLEKLAPQNPDIIYNKACIFARLGQKKDALDTLEQSIDDGYVDSDHMQKDDDLQTIRDDPRFKMLMDKADKVAGDYSRFPYEQGADMPDVKTIEDNPAGGLRYRIRMSKTATADHPDRLLIWFHPSGASMDNTVESLAPEFAKHHLALMVFTQKGYLNWSSTDITRMNKSMEAIGKIAAIDSKKPIGLGFSAGGQIMMQMYDLDPSQFGGMVLDAAYPVEVSPAGKLTIQGAPPKNAAIKKTPLLVFVGGDDGGSQVWRIVGPNWQNQGVPLDVNTVPNRKHEWLIDNADRQKILLDWLDDVTAGKLPGAVAPATQPAIPEQQPQ
jgi:predicted esterase